MEDLFNYFDNKSIHRFKGVIGEFLSRSVNWKKDNGVLITVEEVNNLDRVNLAEEFIKKRTNNGKYRIDAYYDTLREYEEYELVNDIAQYIDFKIPLHYWIHLKHKEGQEDKEKIRSDYRGIDSIKGLLFIYDDNYILEDELVVKPKEQIEDKVTGGYAQLKGTLKTKLSGSMNYFLRGYDMNIDDEEIINEYLCYCLTYDEEAGNYSYLDKKTYKFIELSNELVNDMKEVLKERIQKKREREKNKK